MTKYKVGDEVLVRARVVEAFTTHVDVEYPHSVGVCAVGYENIIGLAPKPDVDWSRVPMGARVRVRFADSDWKKGRFVCFDAEDQERPYHVLADDRSILGADWFPICELVEEGDE